MVTISILKVNIRIDSLRAEMTNAMNDKSVYYVLVGQLYLCL